MISRLIFFLTLISLLATNSFGQEKKSSEEINTNSRIDSLIQEIPNLKKDTIAIQAYHDLAFELKNYGRHNEALNYLFKAKKLSNELNWVIGRAKVFNVVGMIYYYKIQYDSAMYFYNRSLDVCDSFDLNIYKATVFVNISNIYSEKSDYVEALKFLNQALSIFEESKNKAKVGGALTNIGIIYFYRGEYDTALSYYHKSIDIYKSINDEKNMSFGYMNIGACYAYQNKLTKSLKYFHISADLKRKTNDKHGLCLAYQNIAEISAHLSTLDADSLKSIKDILVYSAANNMKKSLLDSAKLYLEASIDIANEINSESNILAGLSTLARVYIGEKNYKKAISTYQLELKRSKELDHKQSQMDTYNNLAELYIILNKFDSALHYNRLFNQIKDTIFSIEKQKEFGKEEARHIYEREKALQEIEYQNQLKLDQAELKRQKLFQILMVIIIIAVVGISLTIYRALKVSKRQQKEIQEQNNVIENKNSEILSSIRYASRIQNALLKEEENVSKEIPEFFIFFKPRDIVSGDFYWSFQHDDDWYIAVADCTGHGVPGAFLTMLGISYLNEIVSSNEDINPNEILNQLRAKIVTQLSQSENIDDSKDGMDISLIKINLKTLKASWSGAQNPLYIVRDLNKEGEAKIQNDHLKLIEIKGDKQPIGYYSIQKEFTLHHLQLQKNDSIYLFSDGYPDQFGGPNNKKYRYKSFQEFILNHSNLPINEQMEYYAKDFQAWKGDYEQVDDVCVLGFKV